MDTGACPSQFEPDSTPASWWHGDDASRLRADRAELYRRDLGMRRSAWRILVTALFASVSIYSTHAFGVLQGAGDVVAVPVSALMVLAALVWVIDRRLAQQVADAPLYGRVWQELVAAAQCGTFGRERLDPAPGESEADRLLREEAALAVRFVTAAEALTPHLPLLESGIVLRRPVGASRQEQSQQAVQEALAFRSRRQALRVDAQ